MTYVGTKEIDAAINNYQKQVERIFDGVCNKLKKEKQDEIRIAIYTIKKEILSLFQIVCYQEFQAVFYKNYGKNYDVNSLNKSLSFYVDNNLYPHVSYDVSQFVIKTDFNKDKRQFNQNANIEGSFDRLMDFDILSSAEEMDFYGLSIQEDSPYEWAVDGMSEIEDAQVFKRGKVTIEPKYAYKEAEAQAMEKFTHEYECVLLPKFKSKYPSLSRM